MPQPTFFFSIKSIPYDLKKLPPAIKKSTVILFIYYLSWGILIPFLPIYFRDILGSFGAATFVTGLLYLFIMFWSFPIGELVDKISKKKLIRTTLILYLPLWPALAILQTITHFVFFKIYHALLATSLWSTTKSYVRIHSPKDQRSESIGIFETGGKLSLVLGAVIGGALLMFLNMGQLIISLPPLLVIAANIYARGLPDHEGSLSFRKSIKKINWSQLYRKEIQDFWSHPGLRRLIPFIVVMGFLIFSQATMLSLLSDAEGMSLFKIGLLYALFSVPLLFQAPFSVLADRWSDKKMLISGTLMSIIAFFALFFNQSNILIFPLAFLLGLSISAMYPVVSGLATNDMPRAQTGELNAVYGAVEATGAFSGLFIMGYLADAYGIHLPFLISGGVMVVFLFLVLIYWSRAEKCLKDAGR